MGKLPKILVLAVSLGLLLALGAVIGMPRATAASTAVTIQNFKFDPNPLTIPVGTTVTWTNMDTAPHTATSDTGAFDTGMLTTGKSGSITFNQAGTFTYHCSVHPNMHGTIIVQSASTVSTSTPSNVPLSASTIHMPSGLRVGVAHQSQQTTWLAYYDGHKDAYLGTDVSDKAQATALHINYAPVLAHSSALSPMYFVKGRAAAGQLAVFGSEPGEKDYSPLWHEIVVQWKAGARPVLLTRDDQIKALAKVRKLTMHTTPIVYNAPVVPNGS